MSDTERDALQKLGIALAERDILRRECEGLRKDLKDATTLAAQLAAEGDKMQKEIYRMTVMKDEWVTTCGKLNQHADTMRAEIERLRAILREFDPNDPQGFLYIIAEALKDTTHAQS